MCGVGIYWRLKNTIPRIQRLLGDYLRQILKATTSKQSTCFQRGFKGLGLTCVLLRDLRRHLTLGVLVGKKQVNAFKGREEQKKDETERGGEM